MLRAAQGAGVAVPRLVRAVPPGTALGEALITEFVAGETLGRRIVASDQFAPARALLPAQCGAALARLHAIPPASLPALPVLDAAATIAHYRAVYHASGARRPVLDAAFAWLARDLPEPTAPSLVHGDFRTGNLLVDPATGLAAVLDWELAHLGDPAEDLGWLCVNSWRFGAPERRAGGFGSIEDVLAAYSAAGATPIPPARVQFWQMLGSLKWAVMCLIMVGVFESGADPSLERAAIGRRVSECEADLLALMAGRP